MLKWAAGVFVTFPFLALTNGAAFAEALVPPEAAWIAMGSTEFYATSLRALVILFVMAVLIESALAVIFNWRLFLELFYGRGVKTLVMIAVSALVVWTFNIDVVQTMLVKFGFSGTNENAEPLSRFLTALILAGGSAGVYQVFVALGYRQPRKPEDVQPKPKKEKAWISVKVLRKTATGCVYVRITEAGPATQDSPPQLAGVVAPTGFWATVKSVFLLDPDRFPKAGGFEVDSSKQYQIDVSARDLDGGALQADINGIYAFAPGAIIDFRTTL